MVRGWSTCPVRKGCTTILVQPEEEVASGGLNSICARKLLQRRSHDLHNQNRKIPIE